MVVSNTSPLRYLIAVGQVGLTAEVFTHVIIPPAVLAELAHPSSLDDVRRWIEKPPAWLEVRELAGDPDEELAMSLDEGEAEAIQLAVETRADFLLIDELLGRRAAGRRGLTVIGALGATP